MTRIVVATLLVTALGLAGCTGDRMNSAMPMAVRVAGG
jgi:hypothetical protein